MCEAVEQKELRSPTALRKGIARFYDKSSGIWERVWGEHMHHGYYPGGVKKDHKVAQVDMIDAVLDWAGAELAPGQSVLDVGCGIGGSTRHIARRFGCSGRGITLSPVQANRAQELSNEQGLGDRLGFEVADALRMPFADNSFDLIWSLESGEHMPDKATFVSELTRVLKPGGKLIIVTWCHRDLLETETELRPREERLLRSINRAYYLPRWCSVADYVGFLTARGVEGIRRDDWTDDIALFWTAVIRSALRPSSILGLLRSGASTIRGALVMPLMIRGYKKGTIKFGLVTAVKPSSPLKPIATPAAAEPPPKPSPAPSRKRIRVGSEPPAPDGFDWA